MMFQQSSTIDARDPMVTSVGTPAAAASADAAPLRAALRAGTRESHDRIESALALDRLGDDARGIGRYGRVLQAFALFQRHWQPRMRAALPPSLAHWLVASPREAWLAQDLAALGLPWPDTALPDPTAGLTLPDTVTALASLYVLEGSALGGQVIVRALARQAPRVAATANRYFHGQGERTGAHWRGFCAVLDAQTPQGPDAAAAMARAVAAANATFNALLASARALDATVDAAPVVTA